MAEYGIEDPGGNSEEILAKIIESLRQNEATDISLLEIISKHVVTLSPAADAIDQALKDIETLAREKGEQVDQTIRHDRKN